MGRLRTKNLDLPPRVQLKGRSYYVVIPHGGCRLWLRLGADRERAIASASAYLAQYANDPDNPQMRNEAMLRDAYRCAYCGSSEKLCIDHVVPLSRGGDNALSNVVVACRSCNSSKNASHPAIFVDEMVERRRKRAIKQHIGSDQI